MAEDKKPPQKPAQKKAARTKGASKKTASQKTAASQTSGTPRTRKASRPPIIDMTAEEVSPDTAGKPAEKEAQEKQASKTQAAKEEVQPTPSESADKAEKKPTGKDAPAANAKKGSSLAAGGIGLVAGALGGLVAGFIYTNTQTDALPSPAVLALEDRVETIEKTSSTSQPDGALVSRLEKAESDTRFLNTQLDVLSKDIATLKDQLTVFSGKFIPKEDGVEAERPGAQTPPPVDLSGIEAKLAQLEGQMSARTNAADALTKKLAVLQKEIAAERAALNKTNAKQAESYQALTKSVDDKITKLYRAGGDNRIRAAALSLSLGQLVDAAKSAQPFAGQLKAVAALVDDRDTIAKLQPLAQKGVPDIEMLKGAFANISFAGSAPAPKPAGEATLVDKLISSASSVVKVSKVGDKPAPASPLETLKKQLQAGDLNAVVQQAPKLDADAKRKLEPWLKNVEDRITLDAGIAKLQSQILAEIGNASANTSGTGEDRAAPAQSAPPEQTQEPSPVPDKKKDASQHSGEESKIEPLKEAPQQQTGGQANPPQPAKKADEALPSPAPKPEAADAATSAPAQPAAPSGAEGDAQ